MSLNINRFKDVFLYSSYRKVLAYFIIKNLKETTT